MPIEGPIQINLESVLRSKLGTKARLIPKFVVRALANFICQDQLNEMLRLNYPKRGADFCKGVMDHLGLRVAAVNPDKFPGYGQRRLLIVSNHPLGGLDGIALIHSLSQRYGEDIKFIVNDLLMAVEPLTDVFLPINKHGAQSRESIAAINQAMASDAPVMIFPAGLVSRRGPDGVVCDLKWNKMFVNKAVQFHRDVLPIYFSGENTSFFYKFAQWRERIGLKFNIEMLRLPAEIFKCRDRSFSIVVGDVIPWQQLQSGAQAVKQASDVKEIVYSLKPLAVNEL